MLSLVSAENEKGDKRVRESEGIVVEAAKASKSEGVGVNEVRG